MSDDEAIPPTSNMFMDFIAGVGTTIFDKPVTFIREKIICPIQKREPYYHYKFRRVPGIEECRVDDWVCEEEADLQFERDKKVDSAILGILKQRRIECEVYYGHADSYPNNCAKMKADYDQAARDWFTKYGDLGFAGKSKMAMMKQKHRMIWERRNGPVGGPGPYPERKAQL